MTKLWLPVRPVRANAGRAESRSSGENLKLQFFLSLNNNSANRRRHGRVIGKQRANSFVCFPPCSSPIVAIIHHEQYPTTPNASFIYFSLVLREHNYQVDDTAKDILRTGTVRPVKLKGRHTGEVRLSVCHSKQVFWDVLLFCVPLVTTSDGSDMLDALHDNSLFIWRQLVNQNQNSTDCSKEHLESCLYKLCKHCNTPPLLYCGFYIRTGKTLVTNPPTKILKYWGARQNMQRKRPAAFL